MNRLSSLDYLRGLAAFCVMAFHYTMWAKPVYALSAVGIYAVSIFYVLSGLTLYLVYFDKIGNPSKAGLKDFAIKRVFRIFPLLYLCSILTILVNQKIPAWDIIVTNVTGIFSVYRWQWDICYGSWSIANELAFYLFFPVFVFLAKRSKPLFWSFSLLLFLIYIWYAFVYLDSSKPFFGDNWINYLNPFNQVPLFLGGFLIGYLGEKTPVSSKISLPLLILFVLVFRYYPLHGDTIQLVTGIGRMVYTVLCIGICFAFYKTDFHLPQPLHRSFQLLGEISYSVYLMHPLVWHVLSMLPGKYFSYLHPYAEYAIAVPTTLTLSYIIYRFYEKYFMRLGAQLSRRLQPPG